MVEIDIQYIPSISGSTKLDPTKSITIEQGKLNVECKSDGVKSINNQKFTIGETRRSRCKHWWLSVFQLHLPPSISLMIDYSARLLWRATVFLLFLLQPHQIFSPWNSIPKAQPKNLLIRNYCGKQENVCLSDNKLIFNVNIQFFAIVTVLTRLIEKIRSFRWRNLRLRWKTGSAFDAHRDNSCEDCGNRLIRLTIFCSFETDSSSLRLVDYISCTSGKWTWNLGMNNGEISKPFRVSCGIRGDQMIFDLWSIPFQCVHNAQRTFSLNSSVPHAVKRNLRSSLTNALRLRYPVSKYRFSIFTCAVSFE